MWLPEPQLSMPFARPYRVQAIRRVSMHPSPGLKQKLSMGSIGNYRIWLAQYAAAPPYSGRYDMWQYSSKGTISGINGKVDLNLSYLAY